MRNLNRVVGISLRISFVALVLSCVVMILSPDSSLATPPSPPIKIIARVAMKEPQEIGLREGKFELPIRIMLQGKVERYIEKKLLEEIVLRVKARPVEPDPRGKIKLILEQKLQISTKITSQDVKLSLPSPGEVDEELEIWVGTKDGDGAIDRKILYLRLRTKESVVVYTPKQYRSELKDKRWEEFEKNLMMYPDRPDIRKIWQDTRKLDKVEVIPGPKGEESALIRPVGPQSGLRPYFIENEDIGLKKIDPLTIRGRLVYRDFEGTWRPIVNASVNIWDDDTGPDEHLGTVGTDWNGYWSFSCDNDDGIWADGRDIYYTFKLENTRFRVQDCGPWPDETYEWKSAVHDDLKDGSVVDFGTETGSGGDGPMIIWGFLNRAWNHAVTVAGQDPGFVDCCFPEGETHWDRFWEEIDVEQQYTDGPDVVTHEYGHALMWYAYDEDNPSPGGSHSFGDVNQDAGLAWSEGWATGWMLSLCPDGQYNWHEGGVEAVGEYPSCASQNDFGENIERFWSTNRQGELNEGRVAAAINDMLDFPNDCYGGDENVGRSDKCDSNSNDRVALALMYRDAMWGYFHNDFLEFWSSLAGELSGQTETLARNACQYNWMTISEPLTCVATKIVTKNVKGSEEILNGLRKFRDTGLKTFPGGRLLMQTYYRNSPELAVILLKDNEARKKALEILKFFAQRGKTLSNHIRYTEFLNTGESFITNDMESAIEQVFSRLDSKASDNLKKDLIQVKMLFESVKGMTLGEIQQKLENKKIHRWNRIGQRVEPTKRSTESQKSVKELNFDELRLK